MVSLRRVANFPAVSESGPAPAEAAEVAGRFGNDQLPPGCSNFLGPISGRRPAVRAAVTSRWTQLESFDNWVIRTMLDPQLQFISKKRQLALVARRNFVGITRISDDPGPDRHRAVGKGGRDEAELTGAAADIEDTDSGPGNEESCRLGGDADGSPLERRELSNPGWIDLVEPLVFDGPRVLVFEVIFCLQHSVE